MKQKPRATISLLTRTIVLVWFLGFCSCAMAQEGDECHVYLVDSEKGRKAFEAFLNSKPQDLKKLEDPTIILGTFRTQIGEEVLTTKHFEIPNEKKVVTASVFYTDESMALKKPGDTIVYDTSVTLAIHVSKSGVPSAMAFPNNAMAESTYTKDTLGIRVKKSIKLHGREYLLGMECHCNGSGPPE